MTFDNYLKELLGEKGADELKDALESGKTIVIRGKQQTGKSTLVKVLTDAGYHAVEDFDTCEVTLRKPLENVIPDTSELIS